MQSILIHPENAEQLRTVKAVLKALKVQFEPQAELTALPAHVLKSAAKSIAQYEAGQSISFEEFSKKHFTKR